MIAIKITYGKIELLERSLQAFIETFSTLKDKKTRIEVSIADDLLETKIEKITRKRIKPEHVKIKLKFHQAAVLEMALFYMQSHLMDPGTEAEIRSIIFLLNPQTV